VFAAADRFSPADWVIRNPTALDRDGKEVSETLDRPEKVIVAVNKLLGPS
jgi:hypothetical protein